MGIPFFSGTLWLRQGIAVLARMLQVPIYPILNCNRADQSIVQVLPAIRADSVISRERDAMRIMGLLYNELEKWLQHEGLMHWECWKYLHYNGMLRLESPIISNVSAIAYPTPEYMAPLVHPNGHFWIDKSGYVIHYDENILKTSLL